MTTIRITFTGLFLFVPDEKTHTLTVLMPRTGQPGGHPHEPCIVVPTSPDANPSGKGGYRYHRMKNYAITLPPTRRRPDAKVDTLPKEVVDISPFSGGKVPKGLIRDPIARETALAARVHLIDGECTSSDAPCSFKFGDETQRICHRLVWTIANHGDQSLTIQLDKPVEIGALTSGVIEFGIHHEPYDQLPGMGHVPTEPESRTRVDHFDYLYDFFPSPHRPLVAPYYVGGFPPTPMAGPLRGGDPVTCISAKCPPE